MNQKPKTRTKPATKKLRKNIKKKTTTTKPKQAKQINTSTSKKVRLVKKTKLVKKKRIVKKKIQAKPTETPKEHIEVNLDMMSDISEAYQTQKKRQALSKPKQKEEAESGLLSTARFEDLNINDRLKKSIKQVLGFEFLTHIQNKCINRMLVGRDVVAGAQTGSGKTLAFLIPGVQRIYDLRATVKTGTVVLVITPTRELALQIYNEAVKLMSFDDSKTVTVVYGGNNVKMERQKLSRGANILIATPGRLLDHLMNTKGFKLDNLKLLVMDEADQILEEGFEVEVNKILERVSSNRQTALFSATQTRKVEKLVRVSLKSPEYVEHIGKSRTVEGLEQGYVVCPPDKRFRLLLTFLRAQKGKKLMIFFSSCNSVKFHSNLLNYVDVKVLEIHGKQKQQKRQNTYLEFRNLEEGILLCTNVAARGLDIPAVDWIIQFDPPDETNQYIHRVGRTCRGTGRKGRALLFLLSSELGYLTRLRADGVELTEFEFKETRLAKVQKQFQKLVENNYFLKKDAQDAFKSYINAYLSHSSKDIFDVKAIDLNLAALSFGLTNPPRLNIDVVMRSRRNKFGKRKQFKKSSYRK